MWHTLCNLSASAERRAQSVPLECFSSSNQPHSRRINDSNIFDLFRRSKLKIVLKELENVFFFILQKYRILVIKSTAAFENQYV